VPWPFKLSLHSPSHLVSPSPVLSSHLSSPQPGVIASVAPGVLLPALSPQSCVVQAVLLAAGILCKGAVQAAKADPRLAESVASQGGAVVALALGLEGQPAIRAHQLDCFVHLWSLAPFVPVRSAR